MASTGGFPFRPSACLTVEQPSGGFVANNRLLTRAGLSTGGREEQIQGKGISEAVPAIGNEPGRGILPVASADFLRAQDIALFSAFPA